MQPLKGTFKHFYFNPELRCSDEIPNDVTPPQCCALIRRSAHGVAFCGQADLIFDRYAIASGFRARANLTQICGPKMQSYFYASP
jgi:hypothetical protein